MKKTNRRKQLFLCMSAAFILTACKPESGKETAPETDSAEYTTEAGGQITEHQKTETLFERESNSPVTHKTVVSQYDLGERIYQAQSGKTMPYRIRGVAAVPQEEGVYPLVLITHGSHSNEDENLRFDTGFTYLAEELAGRGYVAVAMDMSSAYLWKYGDGDDKEKSIAIAEEQIQVLKSCSEGDQSFPVDIRNKIDWEQISLIGHSRGGDTIFDIALDQQEKGLAVSSLLSIAPAMSADLETKSWPDVPAAILVPEYDGDIVSLDGFAMQTMLAEKNQSPSTVTFLQKANHNYFNANLTTNDALLARSEDQLQNQLQAEEQQKFLVDYTLDFLEGTLLTKNALQPNQMYGQDVMNRTSFQSDINLVTAAEPGALQAEGATVTSVIDSWFYKDDQAAVDTITFGQGSDKIKQLCQLLWDQKGGSISLTPEQTDFSGHNMLTFYFLTDPADERNQDVSHQSLSVTLKDQRGNQATVTLADKRNSLRKAPGAIDSTPMFEEEITFWSTITPIPATSIPLEWFEGVNLSEIERVTMRMDQTERGGGYLERIVLQ